MLITVNEKDLDVEVDVRRRVVWIKKVNFGRRERKEEVTKTKTRP
jgi:hypothetical protein